MFGSIWQARARCLIPPRLLDEVGCYYFPGLAGDRSHWREVVRWSRSHPLCARWQAVGSCRVWQAHVRCLILSRLLTGGMLFAWFGRRTISRA